MVRTEWSWLPIGAGQATDVSLTIMPVVSGEKSGPCKRNAGPRHQPWIRNPWRPTLYRKLISPLPSLTPTILEAKRHRHFCVVDPIPDSVYAE